MLKVNRSDYYPIIIKKKRGKVHEKNSRRTNWLRRQAKRTY